MRIDASEISPKSEMKTVLFALFFNGFGLHRFYTGKYLSGILYVLLGSTATIFRICDALGVSFSHSFTIALICFCISYILALFDIYALYSESFTDGQGRLIVSKATKEENGVFSKKASDTPGADVVMIIALFFLYVDVMYIILPSLF